MYYKNNCFNDYRICLLLYIYNNSLKINNNPIAVINMDILSEKITKYYKDQKIPSNHELFTDPLFPPNTNSINLYFYNISIYTLLAISLRSASVSFQPRHGSVIDLP